MMPAREVAVLPLTPDQQLAVDRSPDIPARVGAPGAHPAEVLLPWEDFTWVREHLADEPEVPCRTHPRTGKLYAVLTEDRYERFRALFEEDPLTPAEREALLRRAGERAGWDDNAWDGVNPGPAAP